MKGFTQSFSSSVHSLAALRVRFKFNAVISAFLLASTLFIVNVAYADTFCWRDNYGRGVGEPLSTCAEGMQQNGALCYPECRDGFSGVGPICWSNCPEGYVDDGATCRLPGDIQTKTNYGRTAGQPMVCAAGFEMNAGLCYPSCADGWSGIATACYAGCPEGFRDDGLFCAKPEPYGRGGGYVAWDLPVCERDHGQGACEMWGAMHYPKCKDGYAPAGCCVCSPVCPEGWDDIGVSCKKPTVNRGIGIVPNACPSGTERDGALCYPTCNAGYQGAGPICWSQCPAGYIDDGATCRKDPVIVAKQSYGRSVGEPLVCREGLQQSGALCYTPCSEKEEGIGPVCWGNCPSSMPYDCGAGCAVSEADCIGSVQKMLIQAAKMTIDIVTFGGTTALDVEDAMDDAANALAKNANEFGMLAGTGAGGQLDGTLGGAAVNIAGSAAISGVAGAGARAAVKATLQELLIPFSSFDDLVSIGTYSDVASWATLLEEAATRVDGDLTGGHILALLSAQMTPTEQDALISQIALALQDEQSTDPFDIISAIPITNPFGVLDFVNTFRMDSCSAYPDTNSASNSLLSPPGLDPYGIPYPVAVYDPDVLQAVEQYEPVTLGVLLTGGIKPSGRQVMSTAKATVDESTIEAALGEDADPALIEEILERFRSGRLFEEPE